MRTDAERWLLQARRDLENARKVIGVAAYEVAAFLAHQAAEKHLKAAWIENKRLRPPATHTLMELGEGLGAPAAVLSTLRFLNPDFVLARNPDAANGLPGDLYDVAAARAKVRASAEIADWCSEALSEKRRRKTDPIVNRFADELLPRLRELYSPELVLVFGSRARDQALVDSDLDLIVVSAHFRDIKFLDRPVQVLTDLDPPFGIDLLCYTPEEFASKREELGLVSQAVEEGIPL